MGKISEIFNFNDIGKKIKNFAMWTCWITIVLIWIAAALITIIYIVDTPEVILLCILGAVIAPFLVWVSCWPMYGFGELIDKAGNANGGQTPVQQPVVKTERDIKLEKLLAQNLITEEEYRRIISKK